MTIIYESTELLVFGGGNRDRHMALLRGQTPPIGFSGSLMLVVKMAD